MKKRILSLFLVGVMIVLAIPAISVFSAEEIDPAALSCEEAYEYYKDLYYDDGHLMAFLNLNSLTENDIAYLTDDNFAVTGKDARIVFGYERDSDGKIIYDKNNDPGLHDATGTNKTYHNYAKILGGKYAGKYYMIATENGRSSPMGITSTGFLDFNETFEKKEAGIYFGAALTFEQIQNKFRSLEHSDGIEGELDGKFYLPSDELLYDETYGKFAIDEAVIASYEDADDNYFSYNTSEWGYNLSILDGFINGIVSHNDFESPIPSGCIRIGPDKGFTIGQIGTGRIHNEGQFGATDTDGWERGSTVHVAYNSIWFESGKMRNSIFAVSNLETGKDVINAKTGTPREYSLRENYMNVHAVQAGFRNYFFRLYDCNLTKEQMAQNHFADICYYYRIKNIDKLKALGSIALTDEFYKSFLIYDLGKVGGTRVEYIQSIVNAAVALYDTLDPDDVKTKINGYFDKLQTCKIKSDKALSDADAVVSEIASYISAARTITPVNDNAAALLENSVDKLSAHMQDAETLKGKINLYKMLVDEIYSTSASAKNAASSSSDIDFVLECMLTVETKVSLADEYSAIAEFNSLGADGIKGKALAEKYLADASNANCSIAPESYIKFAGYQQNLTGDFGMRAIYTVNEDLLDTTYTYNGESYKVLDYGFIHAYAKDDISLVTVDFDVKKNENTGKVEGISEVFSDAEGAHIVRVMDDKRRKLDDADLKTKADIKTGIFGEIYADEKHFREVGYYDYADEFTQEYMFRAYIILSNGDATFAKYVDAVGSTVGDEISLYELASIIDNSDDEVSKRSDLLVAQTIFYVNEYSK